mgnify:FL=1
MYRMHEKVRFDRFLPQKGTKNSVINEESMTEIVRKFYERVTERFQMLRKHMFLSSVCHNNIRKSQKN